MADSMTRRFDTPKLFYEFDSLHGVDPGAASKLLDVIVRGADAGLRDGVTVDAEVDAVSRLLAFRGSREDVRRLVEAAEAASLPWAEMFGDWLDAEAEESFDGDEVAS